jgi:hypothetical protein
LEFSTIYAKYLKWDLNKNLLEQNKKNHPQIFTTPFLNLLSKGRAVAQAVSRWFPTAEARVGVRAGM